MRRRSAERALARAVLGTALLLAVPAAPRAATGQSEPRVPWIGFLANEPTPESAPVLRARLAELGWIEGQHVKFWYRYAQGKFELFPGHAEELVRLGVSVIVAWSPPAIEAARKATTTTPIVIATTDDPVANGLVASLSRPGGNVTGFTMAIPGLAARRLQLLKRAVPAAARVAVLWNPTNPSVTAELKETQAAARALGVEVVPVALSANTELRVALGAITSAQVGGLVVLADLVTVTHRAELVKFTARNRLPAVYPLPEFVDAGGLLAYGGSWSDAFRRVAGRVDRILKGAAPGELPVERPERFELHVNLKAAKALELSLSSTLLSGADRVVR